MKPVIYWIEKVLWRPIGADEFESVHLRRGRLRVMQPDSIAYFYIEDGAQMQSIYEAWDGGSGEIQLRIHLQDVHEPQTVAGIPKPETPPFKNPPYHVKLRFATDVLTVPLEEG